MSRRSLVPPQQTRDAILDTADRLFRQAGYGKTTIGDIAAALGMSGANVYRFFPSKSAINNAICERLMAAQRKLVAAAAAEPGTAAERLTRLITTLGRVNREMLTDERRVFDMVDVAIAENWAAIEAHVDAMHALAGSIVADGIASGEFSPGDPLALGAAAMNACAQLLHPTLLVQCSRKEDAAKQAERVVWLAIEALRNPNRSKMP
jgi:AcrR family transcriptional regulator